MFDKMELKQMPEREPNLCTFCDDPKEEGQEACKNEVCKDELKQWNEAYAKKDSTAFFKEVPWN